jgi:hypothetical protein
MGRDRQDFIGRCGLVLARTTTPLEAVMSLIGNAYMTSQTIAWSGGMTFN